MPTTLNPKLISWASILDDATLRQAERLARLDVVTAPVALMPDAHYGIDSTVGTVIPTETVIIPAAIGGDIGCGVIAVETNLTAPQLPDDLSRLLSAIERVVPAGRARGHQEHVAPAARAWMATHHPRTTLTTEQEGRALSQLGTLGGGNHFVEICLDQDDHVWVTLHSGSRNSGQLVANLAIENAKTLARDLHLALEDPSLAYLLEGTTEFDTYIADMLWAQEYALTNRAFMMNRVLRELLSFVPALKEVSRLNSHHNFTARETHHDVPMWITRKGAVRAAVGDRGMIPGSMGARSYIIEGLGNPASYNSCAHGAGRLMGRSQAKSAYSAAELTEQMSGITWLADRASSQVDEIPSAYKPIGRVMADQADLVRITHTLRQVLNYKGC